MKEQCWGIMATLPFKALPNIMVINLVHSCMPVKSGISEVFSLRELIHHQNVDAKQWCRLMSGEYAESHDENTIETP